MCARAWIAIALLGIGGFAASAGGDSGSCRIGAGDLLHVQVWREPDLSGELRVVEDGTVRHVLVGSVPAAGHTCDQVAEELRERLERDYLREARVLVRVRESVRQQAAVLGAVARPGSHPVRPEMRLLDLLLAAGGPTPDAASQATLLRFGEPAPGEALPEPGERAPREQLRIDLDALLHQGAAEHNPPLRAGDVLVVERRSEDGASLATAEGRVRIVGEVARPGSYSLAEAPTLLDALLAAGGLSEWAAGNRARLVRGSGDERIEERIRLDDVARGRAGAENLELQDGDLLVVPESYF
jgi:polysaccharide export outer membrane protein